MADQDEVNGLILNNLARLAARLSQMAGDVRAIRQTLEERRERDEFAEILARLKARGVITQEDVERLERDGLKEGTL